MNQCCSHRSCPVGVRANRGFAVVRVGRRIDAAHIVERAITQAIGVQVYAFATRAGALAGSDRALLVREAPFAGE